MQLNDSLFYLLVTDGWSGVKIEVKYNYLGLGFIKNDTKHKIWA